MKTNLFLFAITSTIISILFEISVRIFAPQNLINNQPIYLPDAKFEKRLIPNSEFNFGSPEYGYTVYTNRDGFRDRNHELEKSANTKRILILGDSYTYGPGVAQDKIYPNQLERLLNQQKTSVSYETLTMACGGYGPEHYFALLQNSGVSYKPDIVLLAIFVDNDITDELDAGSPLLPPDRGVLQNSLYAINNFLETRSQAFLFVRARVDYPLWKFGLRPYYFPEVFWRQVPTYLEKDWKRTFKVLELTKSFCQQERIELIAVLIPAIYQVDDKIWEKYLKVYNIDSNKVDLRLPQKKLTRFFNENDVATIDLLPDFRNAAGGEQLYFPIDRHWNEAGHALCAELIYAELLKPSQSNIE